MKKLQEQLDTKKWYESELAERDLSGSMPWCADCIHQENKECKITQQEREQNDECANAFEKQKGNGDFCFCDSEVIDRPYTPDDVFCNSCEFISAPKDREPLSSCDRVCSKYNVDLEFYDWFLRCKECIDDEGKDI